MEDLENLSLVELKELAKNKDIKNISKLKKEELIELLSEKDNKENNNEDLNERYKVTSDGDTIVEGILEVSSSITFKALVFRPVFVIQPFSANLFKYECTDDVDFKPTATQISLTDGG